MRCSKMTEEFMRANPEKYYFDYKELILQCITEYETIETFYDRIQKVLPKCLKNLQIDIKLFETTHKRYEIPILFAEIIYIIVREAAKDSSTNSFVSLLKNNKFNKLSFDNKLKFIIMVFDELKKDYPTHIEVIEKVEFNFLYPYYNVKDLMNFKDKLCQIESLIELPLIGYDKEINDFFHGIFTQSEGKIEEKYKEQYNKLIKHAGHQLAEQLWSLRGSTYLLLQDNELNECFEKLKADIENLKQVLTRVERESKEAHKNHLLYFDV